MPEAPVFATVDRRALRSVALQFFVNGALFASFMPRLPEIRDRVGISVTTVGLLLSAAGVSGLLGSAAVGPAIARFGTRRVMLAASATVSLSLAVVGLATTPLVLLIGLMGMLTFDLLVDVAMNMQGSWLSARRHAPVMNRLHGLWSLGTLVGGAAASRIAAAGVSLTLHLVGAAAVLMSVLVYVGAGLLRVDESHAPPEPVAGRARPNGRTRAPLILFGLAGFFAVTMESTASDWAAFRIGDDFATGAGFAALGYVAVAGGMTFARFAGDSVSVRLGPDRLVRLAIALAATGLAVAAFVPQRHVVLAGFVLAGLGIATQLPVLYDRAAKLPGRPGAGLGALTAGLRVALLSIPLAVGALAGTSWTVGAAVAAVTLPSAVGFWLVTTRLRAD